MVQMIFGVLMMAGGFASVIYGNFMNNDFSTQLAYYHSDGNPGDIWMILGVVAIIIGAILVIYGAKVTKADSQNNASANKLTRSSSDQLKEYQRQLQKGLINEEEFNAKRDELLKEIAKQL